MCKIDNINEMILQRKTKWDEHIGCMSDERIVKITRDQSPFGQRSNGKARKNWRDNHTLDGNQEKCRRRTGKMLRSKMEEEEKDCLQTIRVVRIWIPLHLVFVDYHIAFDSIDTWGFLDTLELIKNIETSIRI